MPAAAPSGRQRPPGARLNPFPPAATAGDDDETTTDDDSSDEEAALEMDGQELWTQNYCATCDCLIEPGEGLSKEGDAVAPKASHTNLKSRSGTIKARATEANPEQQQQQQQRGGAANNANARGAELKRTHSAGRIQARGANGLLGPNKRTGSAGSRLNALSELRPTTKLHPPAQEDAKGRGKSTTQDGKGPGRRSPAMSRRGSSASVKSVGHGHSGPSSVKSEEVTGSGPGASKPKVRGLLGGLTPAALKQQQAEMAEKTKAPAQLYCSERCRAIDENRSTDLGELSQYLSQPLQPPPSAAWVQHGWPVGPAASQWPRSASLASVSISYVAGTPDSDCMCPECMEKCTEGGSAGGATVPSGASDTTESSGGYPFARPATGTKARTASGRIVTPLNLHPPGGSAAVDSYFPVIVGQPPPPKHSSASGARSKQVDGVAVDANTGRMVPLPPRTSSAGPVGSASTADTESSGSNASLWEPKLRRTSEAAGSGTIKRTGPAKLVDRRREDSCGLVVESSTSGRTTVTATPAITPRQSIVQPSLPSSSGQRTLSSARHSHTLSVPTSASHDGEREHSATSSHSPDASDPRRFPTPATANTNLANLATSPLNLLRGSSHHIRAAPSVDVWNEHVGSPAAAKGSFLSRSLAASENTVQDSSAITVSATNDARQHHQRSFSYAASTPTQRGSSANVVDVSHGLGQTSSRDGDGRQQAGSPSADGLSLSLAVGSLKLAQSRARPRHASTSVYDRKSVQSRRLSLFGPIVAAGERRSSTTSSSYASNLSWFRSISSAWATIRGAPSGLERSSDIEHGAAVADADQDGNGGDAGARFSYNPDHRQDRRRTSTSSRRSNQLQASAAPTAETEGLSQQHHAVLSQSPTKQERDATPTQSLVAKPTIRRGRVPAFVKEIGQGEIPGDAIEHYGDERSESYSSVGALGYSASTELQGREVGSSRATGVSEEEKARRRQERKEANRQRRSRDIHVLPPLLAPISRTNSSTNLLYSNVPRSARASSQSRQRTTSATPHMVVGSAGAAFGHAAVPPQRSTTPGMLGYTNGPPSPGMMRSPFQGAFPPLAADGRSILSPSRPGSAAGFYSAGTSPRVKGLGWGAMTSISQAPTLPASTQPLVAGGHHHHHSCSIGYGHAAAAASRAPHHGHNHRHSLHAINGYTQPGPHRGPLPVRHHTSLQLGTLGTLGSHPHGHAPVAGRHSTMPTMLQRSPTPSVPEDGGEMSSQDLTGGDFIPRPNSAMAQGHRHRVSMMPPPRSRSSMGVETADGRRRDAAEASSAAHPHATAGYADETAASNRTWSYEALPGLKTYPVLQLPNRETHDVYDSGWGLDAGGLAKHLTGRPLREEGAGDATGAGDAQAAGYAPSQHRKKLFYFDA
ncbi:hypothetical protein ACQY0O_008218 [Thecaphora frezii]